MSAGDPRVRVGAVAAECGPEQRGNVNPVVEDVVRAGLCSGYHEAFGSAAAGVAVFVHNALDAPLHPVPAPLVEAACLRNDVGQGESRQFVVSGECVRAWKYVTPVKCSIGSEISVDGLVVVGPLFVFSPHLLAGIFIFKLQKRWKVIYAHIINV